MALGDILYTDRLVEITEKTICFRIYYFPFGSKRVRFEDISEVSVAKPTLSNGKYRLHGSGDLMTWFPRDWHRPSRSLIFFAHLCRSSRIIGFTVEDAEKVEQIFSENLLLRDGQGGYRGG